MKKYIKPSVEVELLGMDNILAALSNTNERSDNTDYAKEFNPQSLSSQTFSLWGDDEE